MSLSRIILAFLVIGLVGQILYYYPNLPDRMASHFNGAGEPDGWMSKQNFLIFEAVILLLIIAEFSLLPLLIEKMPASLINLPNKTHWLSETNRTATFAVIRQYFEWFSVGLLALFIAVNEMVFRANLNKQPLSNSIWIVLIVFLLLVGIWLVKFILRFRVKK
jgi:uncharacterized membrane protein